MLKCLASIALGAALASSPLVSVAQTPAGASATHYAPGHRPSGSHKSRMAQRHNLSQERARASAEHVRQMRLKKH